MKEDYTATISSDKLNLFGGWTCSISCNDLTTFNELCEHIRAFKGVVNDNTNRS